MNAFNTSGPSVFITDPVFNGRNLGLAKRSQALGLGLGTVPSKASINTIKTLPADKTRRIQKGTI